MSPFVLVFFILQLQIKSVFPPFKERTPTIYVKALHSLSGNYCVYKTPSKKIKNKIGSFDLCPPGATPAHRAKQTLHNRLAALRLTTQNGFTYLPNYKNPYYRFSYTVNLISS